MHIYIAGNPNRAASRTHSTGPVTVLPFLIPLNKLSFARNSRAIIRVNTCNEGCSQRVEAGAGMTIEGIQRNAARWFSQGVSPRRLALTLALGFAVGCLPVVGIPTVLCAGLALTLGLNLPAIQAANYAAMPFQLALLVPFARLGERLFSAAPQLAAAPAPSAVAPGGWLHVSASSFAAQSAGFVGHALAAWLLIAVPAVLILFAPLTLVLRRIPALAAAEAGD